MNGNQARGFASVWARDRARLNHDVLCNKVLVGFAAVRAGGGNVRPALSLWLGQIPAYRELIRRASEALNAGVVVDTSRFASCWPTEQRDFFRPVFRAMFLNTHGIHRKVAELLETLDDCERIARDYFGGNTNQMDEAERLLRHLSAGISELPDASIFGRG